jgi:Tol biopolymer transport system component
MGTCWSRDGLRLAFESDREGNFEIFTINVNGSGLTRLTHTSADDQWPAWSPR